MKGLTLTYSLSDQNFATTKSLGILNLSLNLIHHLSRHPALHQATVLGNSTLRDRLDLPPGVRFVNQDQAVRSRLGRVLWDQLGVYRAARAAGHQWLFLPKGFAPVIRRCPAKLATCVADGMQDFYRRNYPRAISRLERWYFLAGFAATVRRSTVIFTISDFTSTEVARLAKDLSSPTPRIVTIGIGFAKPTTAPGEKDDRILVLASRWPHKRTDLALRYLERWQATAGFSGEVVWVGALPAGLRLPALANWRLADRLAEAEYRRLLERSRVLIYFSEYEGFGMPPVEAALAGACPVYSDIPVTREVMRGTGCAFINDSFESFAQSLGNALKVPRGQLKAWADRLHDRHNWDRVVGRVIFHLTELAGASAGRRPEGASAGLYLVGER
jgi:glycosyltransferase involved in cell wall biosynthesis